MAGTGFIAAVLGLRWLRKRKAQKQHSVVEPAAPRFVDDPNDKLEAPPYVEASSPPAEMGRREPVARDRLAGSVPT